MAIIGCVLAVVALAADLCGRWHAEFTSPDGVLRENTFTFNMEGETLIGTVAGSQDETPIKDGKMISLTAGRPFSTCNYKGTISGDENHGEVCKVSVGSGDLKEAEKRLSESAGTNPGTVGSFPAAQKSVSY